MMYVYIWYVTQYGKNDPPSGFGTSPQLISRYGIGYFLSIHIRNSILIVGFRRQFVIYKLALVRDLYRENLSRPNSKGLGTLGSRVHSVLSKYRGSCQKSDGGERSPYCVAYFICTHIICTCLGILRFTLICFISYS